MESRWDSGTRLPGRIHTVTLTNPEGIESFSPGLREPSYPGATHRTSSTLKGLNGAVTTAAADDATPLGFGIIGVTMTQGSLALRINPGLSDGIPLGFRVCVN